MVSKARKALTPYVLVIEEINRGNPAQSNKRSPNDAIELCYSDQEGKDLPVYILQTCSLLEQ